MKKKILKLLICILMVESVGSVVGVIAQTETNKVENCPECVVDTVTKKSNDTVNVTKTSTGSAAQVKRVECFNCDQRPCVATKEAWIRLWHKYWGVDTTKASGSPAKEDR